MLGRILNSNNAKLFTPPMQMLYSKHLPNCPTKVPKCEDSGKKSNDGGKIKLVRQEPGKVRMGFLPEEWFQFFHPLTGVSGPYIFAIAVGNYLFSKEIYVMEHEYYSGLSVLVILIVLIKKFGRQVGDALDKEVDAYSSEMEAGRLANINALQESIGMEKHSQFCAEGQKLLIDAKKENVLMQLEAAYRERCMLLYSSVKGRLDYHAKRYFAESRIHQKWMIGWILQNVNSSITPDFQKAVFDKCINDLTALAGRA